MTNKECLLKSRLENQNINKNTLSQISLIYTLYNSICYIEYSTLYNSICYIEYSTLYNSICYIEYSTLVSATQSIALYIIVSVTQSIAYMVHTTQLTQVHYKDFITNSCDIEMLQSQSNYINKVAAMTIALSLYIACTNTLMIDTCNSIISIYRTHKHINDRIISIYRIHKHINDR